MDVRVVVTRNIPLAEATEEEKIHLAKKNRRKAVLEALAKEESPKVKLALFQNPSLPYEVVSEILEKDKNEAIQNAVKKYWEKKIDCNLIFVHLIQSFFSEIPDFSDKKVKKGITAFLFLLNQYYEFIYQDEQGHCIYFETRSPMSHEVYSKALEHKFLDLEYLCEHKYQMFEGKLKYQDKVYQKVRKIRTWFDETKRPEGKDDWEWLTIMGEYMMAIRKYQKNSLITCEKLNVKKEKDNPYLYAYESLNELFL